MLNFRSLRAAGTALAFVATFLPLSGHAATPEKGDTVQLPAITLLDGSTLSAQDLNQGPVIIEYWASWCPFCARQNPYLQKLHEQAQGSNLRVLSISIDKKPEDASGYMQNKGYTFPVAMDTPELREVFGKRRVIPKIFVITDGKVAEVIPGEMFEEDVLELIEYAGPR